MNSSQFSELKQQHKKTNSLSKLDDRQMKITTQKAENEKLRHTNEHLLDQLRQLQTDGMNQSQMKISRLESEKAVLNEQLKASANSRF